MSGCSVAILASCRTRSGKSCIWQTEASGPWLGLCVWRGLDWGGMYICTFENCSFGTLSGFSAALSPCLVFKSYPIHMECVTELRRDSFSLSEQRLQCNRTYERGLIAEGSADIILLETKS